MKPFAVLNYNIISNLSEDTEAVSLVSFLIGNERMKEKEREWDLFFVTKQLRESVKKFADETVAPLAEETDRKNSFPNHLWREFGNMGLLGITVPSKLFF